MNSNMKRIIASFLLVILAFIDNSKRPAEQTGTKS